MLGNHKSKYQEKLNSTIQSFLNKFVINATVESSTFEFKSNPNVYIVESQVPELWLKSKNPFDKNSSFVENGYQIKHPANFFPR